MRFGFVFNVWEEGKFVEVVLVGCGFDSFGFRALLFDILCYEYGYD